MSHNLLNSLHTSVLPINEIGQAAHRLTQAIDISIPVVPTAIIPVSTLQEIAAHNQLEQKVKRYTDTLQLNDPHQSEVALNSIKRALRHQLIPEHLHRHLTTIYQQQLRNECVSLTASFLDKDRTEVLTHENVKGDVNLFESLLSLWAEALVFTSHTVDLFPAAFIIQAQTQPDASGNLYTAHPATGDKNRLLVESLRGVFNEKLNQEKDVYELDSRTHILVKSQIGLQLEYLKRSLDNLVIESLPSQQQGKASLNVTQTKQLGEWAMKLKQQFLSQLKIEWQLLNGKLFISSVNPYHLVEHDRSHHQEILVIGDSFIGGYIQGTCYPSGSILVVDRLTKSHQGLIRQASAIVTEEAITDSLLTQLINYYHIPTIINATHATRRLTSGQEVIVDASGGKVMKHVISSTVLRTATKIIALVNNPYAHMEPYADGHYFKSDFSFLTDNLSPQELVISKQARIISETITKRLMTLSDQPLWYRFNSIHQGQLSPKARSLDQPESNPYFGRRGAVLHLSEPAVFNFEVQLLKKVLTTTQAPMKVILPFVRTPTEKELFSYQLQTMLGEYSSQIEIWLELINPDSIINIPHYLSPQIKGVILPLTHLHALWHGLDPENASLLKEYPKNGEFLSQMLSFIKPHISSIMVEMSQFNPVFLETSVKNGLTFIATKQNYLKQTKEHLNRLEERLITHGSH